MAKLLQYLKLGLPIAIFLVIVFFLWRGLSLHPHRIPSPYINKPAPHFSAHLLEQPEKVVTNATFKGHVSLLNVFASWCVSCRAEHPVLMDIHDSHLVNIYGLNFRDKRKSAIAWLKKFGDPYTEVLFDPTGKIGINFGVYGTPETFVIDQHGVVRYKYIGPISPTEWHDTLRPEILKLERGRA